MYTRSQRIKAKRGQSLGQIYDPYFNRTFRHFCSHQHTPNRPEPSGFDSGVRNGSIIYLAHPVFTLYCAVGAVTCQKYVLRVIDALLGENRTLETNLPSTARITLRRQPEERRQIVHLLYAEKISRGGKMQLESLPTAGFTLEVIEEATPLHDIHVSVRAGKRIERVTLEPQGKEIKFREEKGRVLIELDSFLCHQMVALHEA
jgi:hypothetical protein